MVQEAQEEGMIDGTALFRTLTFILLDSDSGFKGKERREGIEKRGKCTQD